MSYVVLMPIFAKEILGGDSQTLGFLMAAAGLGALAGTFFLASRKDARGLEKIITNGTAIFGLSLAIFSFSRNLWLSLLLLFTGGFGMMIQMGASNTVLQTLTHDDKRGRVMSFFAMAFMGMAPFGSLLAGALASKIGATHTLLLSGLSCLIGSAVFARKLSA
jgi:MFS family permease